VRWVSFVKKIRPMTSFTLGGRNWIRSQRRTREEFYLLGSCATMQDSTSIAAAPSSSPGLGRTARCAALSNPDSMVGGDLLDRLAATDRLHWDS
jgi:hypothetical protein